MKIRDFFGYTGKIIFEGALGGVKPGRFIEDRNGKKFLVISIEVGGRPVIPKINVVGQDGAAYTFTLPVFLQSVVVPGSEHGSSYWEALKLDIYEPPNAEGNTRKKICTLCLPEDKRFDVIVIYTGSHNRVFSFQRQIVDAPPTKLTEIEEQARNSLLEPWSAKAYNLNMSLMLAQDKPSKPETPKAPSQKMERLCRYKPTGQVCLLESEKDGWYTIACPSNGVVCRGTMNYEDFTKYYDLMVGYFIGGTFCDKEDATTKVVITGFKVKKSKIKILLSLDGESGLKSRMSLTDFSSAYKSTCK